MDRGAADWQPEIRDGDQELGLACSLFEASAVAFAALLKVLSTNSTKLDVTSYRVLCNEFRKYYMWNEGFSTRSGGLDLALSGSRNLKAIVLKLMAQWARAVCRVPIFFPSYDWSSAIPTLIDLEVLADKASQVAEATTAEIRTHFSLINVPSELLSESDSDLDLGSDTSSVRSDAVFDDVIEDLNVYVENLIDLTPSLENPAKDAVVIEVSDRGAIEEFSSIPEPIRPFAMIIRDRFPSAEDILVGKLGEANWHRRERLRQQFASNPTVEYADSINDESSSVADTIRGPDQQSAAESYQSSNDVSTTHQSRTTGSDFSEYSMFDTSSITFPIRRNNSIAESVTSFATSLLDGSEYGQRRIPKLPDDHNFEDSFQCQLCGVVLQHIRNRADWRFTKHVYDDLQPYICLFTDCNLGLKTFRSRREWIEHEFQVHRVNQQWCCNLCRKVLDSQENFRVHLKDFHQSTLPSSQIEEFITASKRFVIRSGHEEKCPFCLTEPSQTQKSFASHVGRHLQEISLAALPLLDASSDDEGDSESNDDEKDDDDDDEEDDNDEEDEDKNVIENGDGRDPEKGIPPIIENKDEEKNKLDAGKRLAPTKVVKPDEISNTEKIGENEAVYENTEFDHGPLIISLIKHVISFLAALKVLWVALERLTLRRVMVAEASYAYVKVEYEFNIVCEDFSAAQIDSSDFGNTPELLHDIMKAATNQETTMETREECLSSLQKISIALIEQLNQKLQTAMQSEYAHREELHRKMQQGVALKPDRSHTHDSEWQALYTEFKTEQKALLQQIELGQSFSMPDNPTITSLPRPGQIFQAGWDYEARFDDELSLKKGDLVELVQWEDTCGPGWYLGRHQQSSKIGLFPAGFTRSVSDELGFPVTQAITLPDNTNEPQTESTSNLTTPTDQSASDLAPKTTRQSQIGTLVVTIDCAKDLPDRKLIGKQDPYCVARLGKQSSRTATHRKGGKTPIWNQLMEFSIYDSPEYYVMKLSVFNDNKKAELIGEALVDLREVIISGESGSRGYFWYKLSYTANDTVELRHTPTSPNLARSAGEIGLRLKYVDAKSDRKRDSKSPNHSSPDQEKENSSTTFEKKQTSESENKPLKTRFEVQGQEEASSASTSLGKIKIVLVGDSPRLKTNLLISFVTKKWPPVYFPTVLENYEVLVTIFGKSYTLAFFDTAGQENYDRLRPLTLQKGDVFLICAALGAQEQYESARYKWAPELERFCSGVPSILVGIRQPADGNTEAGQEKVPELGQETELEYGRNIAKKIGALTYLECDISNREGLEDVLEQAVLATLGQHPKQQKSRRLSQLLFGRKPEN